ncbi:MAG: FHA domain-containing protein [Gammaproteobacteria bacterium]
MVAMLGGSSLSPVPEGVAGPDSSVDSAGVLAGLAYVNRCLRGHRSFGIITGSFGAMEVFVERVLAEYATRDDLHVIRVTAPTDSVQTFLGDCLSQLGFELNQVCLDDLHNLLVVFLRHESARGRRTVAVIQETEHCGPRVLEFMHTLSKVRAGATPAMTFLVTGSRDLHRVLDSPGMSGLRRFTRERFDVDRSFAWVTPIANEGVTKVASLPGGRPPRLHPAPAPAPAAAVAMAMATERRLIVMLDGTLIERRSLEPGRLLIGRSPKSALRLDSRYVSRHHAALIITNDDTMLVDLRSTNATLVNGQAVASKALDHGDMLAIGNFRLRYDCRRQPLPVRE